MKVLLVGDSPLAKTGFGKVNYHAVKAFLRQGWEVASVTGLVYEPPETDLPVQFFVPSPSDPTGMMKAIEVLSTKAFEPDVIYTTGDPGSVSMAALVIPEDMPTVAYVPIEGEPLVNSTWIGTLSAIDFFTCSKYGADVAGRTLKRDVDYVYHGVDRSSFFPLADKERAEYRKRLGWDGRFVVTSVAQNVRRKQLTRLIEAVAILHRQYRQKDVLLYLHTVPFQKHWLEGWNLPEVSAAFGLASEVVFNPLMDGFGKGVPETGDMDVPGLRELVGSADLFVLPSQVEGFGLPIAEAMAVGTPVAVTKYAAGWEVAKIGGGVGIPVHDYEIHKSGTRYANLDPQEIAKTILSLKRHPRRLAQMREQGLAVVDQFDWAMFEEHVVARIEKTVRSRHEAGSRVPTEEDQRRTEAGS